MTARRDEGAALLTMDDVSRRLGKCTRWLRDWLKGRDYGRLVGRSRMFTEGDYLMMVEAFRCRSSSSRQKRAATRFTGLGAHTSESTWTELQALLTKERRGNFSSSGETKLRAVNFARPTLPGGR